MRRAGSPASGPSCHSFSAFSSRRLATRSWADCSAGLRTLLSDGSGPDRTSQGRQGAHLRRRSPGSRCGTRAHRRTRPSCATSGGVAAGGPGRRPGRAGCRQVRRPRALRLAASSERRLGPCQFRRRSAGAFGQRLAPSGSGAADECPGSAAVEDPAVQSGPRRRCHSCHEGCRRPRSTRGQGAHPSRAGPGIRNSSQVPSHW